MRTILLAGSAVMDFIFMVDEMPRKADKYPARHAWISGGGCSANAAVAVQRLGGAATLAACIGNDEVGDMIVSGLRKEGVDCRFVRQAEGHTSSFSSVFIDTRGERQIVNYRDEALTKDASWLNFADDARYDAVLGDARWVELAAKSMTLARNLNVPGVLDVEARVLMDADTMALATHVCFSAEGLADFTGTAELKLALKIAHVKTGAFVCVTRGSQGTFFHQEDGSICHVPAFPVSAVETLGAGDIWHGAFALGLGQGMPEAKAIRFANAVAALKCTRAGGRSSFPSGSDVKHFLVSLDADF